MPTARRWIKLSQAGATIAASGGGGGGGSNPAPLYHTATANYSVVAPTATDGLNWLVILVQDATGGWTITWDTIIKFAPVLSTSAGTADPSTTATALFTAQGGFWWYCGGVIGRKQ